MKKIRVLISIILLGSLLMGCAQAISLTTEQRDEIAQYAAGVLYKHSYSFLSKYPNYNMDNPVEEETTAEEETPVIEPGETTTDGETASETETEPVKPVLDVADALNIGTVEVSYNSARTTSEYPDDADAMFSMPADDGQVFLVVNFDLYNPSSEAVTVNTIDTMPVFELTLEDGTHYNNYGSLALISNDFSGLQDFTLEAGETKTAILLFMIDAGYADNLGTFTVSYGDEAKVICR